MVGLALDKCEIFFSLDDVTDKTITLTEAEREEFTGQWIVKCKCKQNVIKIGAIAKK